MMSPRRFAIIAAGLCGTAILVGCVIAAVSGFGLADIKNTHAPPIEDRATEMGESRLRGGIGLAADDCNCRGLVAGVFAARSATSRRSRR